MGHVTNIFLSKKTIPFLERAKAMPGCVVMNREKCSKPMAECLQRKSCDLPTTNLVRGDPQKNKKFPRESDWTASAGKIETFFRNM